MHYLSTQIFIKTMKFTNLTTTKNFQIKGVKNNLQWLFWQSGWITLNNVVYAEASEWCKCVCIIPGVEFCSQTSLVQSDLHTKNVNDFKKCPALFPLFCKVELIHFWCLYAHRYMDTHMQGHKPPSSQFSEISFVHPWNY